MKHSRFIIIFIVFIIVFTTSTYAFGLDSSSNILKKADHEKCNNTIDEYRTVEELYGDVILEEISGEDLAILEEETSDFNEIIGLDKDEFKVNVKPAVDIPHKVVKSVISEYFKVRSDSINGDVKRTKESEDMLRSVLDTGDRDFTAKEYKRLDMKEDMEELYDISIVSADVFTNVERFERVCSEPNKDTYEADVYEWTWIYYTTEGSDIIDRMGYGISHAINVEVDENDNAVITKDDFDDTYIFNYNDCPDAIMEAENVRNESSIEESGGKYCPAESESIEATSIDQDDLNLNILIDYADNWVIHDISDTLVAHYDSYNSNYKYSYNNDCANYVSQCLKAGNVPTSSTWNYNNSWGNTLEDCSTQAWRFADVLVAYFSSMGVEYKVINDSFNNIYAGDPVVTKGEGHVAICVGYNSAGVPIINGHTRDVYHQILTISNTAGCYYKTLRFFKLNKSWQNPANATQIYPGATTKTISSVSIAPQKAKYYKWNVTSANSYTFHFENVTNSNNPMWATVYRKINPNSSYGQPMYMYKVGRYVADSSSGKTFTVTIPSNKTGWYYVKFYHKKKSTQSVTFTYKKN